jgi:hypothetical protein
VQGGVRSDATWRRRESGGGVGLRAVGWSHGGRYAYVLVLNVQRTRCDAKRGSGREERESENSDSFRLYPSSFASETP